MKFQMVNSIFTITFDSLGTLTLGSLVLLMGFWVKNKFSFLDKFCIPAPVVGGFIFVFLNFIFHMSGAVVLKFETTYMSIFMLTFFTTVGLGANLRLLITGGKLLLIYWGLNVAVTAFQTGVGIFASPLAGMHSAYGIVAGPVALVGGHGGAAAYGQTLEGMGFPGASIVGLAAATYGLVVGSLLGGPLARYLITKNNLKPIEDEEGFDIDTSGYYASNEKKEMSYIDMMKNIAVIFLSMMLGTMIVGMIGKAIGMTIPSYVGAMFFAVLLRNLNEKFKFYNFNIGFNDKVGDVCLGLFLSMALITIKLWELADLAGPLLIILILQTLVLLSYAYFVAFPILGRNYDAAVMCSGMMGHDLGATPTAVANMTTVIEKYGPSKKALIVVPIVGAFLIDVFYQPFVVYCINLVAR